MLKSKLTADVMENEGWTQITHEDQNGGFDWEKDGLYLQSVNTFGMFHVATEKYRNFSRLITRSFTGFIMDLETLEIVVRLLKNPHDQEGGENAS